MCTTGTPDIFYAQTGSLFRHRRFKTLEYNAVPPISLKSCAHVVDSSQSAIKHFRRNNPCIPRTAAPNFVVSYRHSSRTGVRRNLARYTNYVLSFKSVPFVDR